MPEPSGRSIQELIRDTMSGHRRGPLAALARGTLGAIEPLYRLIVSARNRRFNRGKGVQRLPVPVISIGNITAGGTGKTPVALWACRRLREEGHHPAILLRGYRAGKDGQSDEATLLDRELNGNGNGAGSLAVPIKADPDRIAGGRDVLWRHDDVDVLVLDDGFQHRRLHRDFNLVLIDATNPFGYGHVHPRGLLREPLSGLSRADAILLTRVDMALPDAIAEIEAAARDYALRVPIYRSSHAHAALRDAAGATLPLSALAERRFFAFGGIGNPDAFDRQLQALGGVYTGRRWFGDHHNYTAEDVKQLEHQALQVGADLLLTTEKDWVKVSAITQSALAAGVDRRLPIWRVELTLHFNGSDERRLLDQMLAAMKG